MDLGFLLQILAIFGPHLGFYEISEWQHCLWRIFFFVLLIKRFKLHRLSIYLSKLFLYLYLSMLFLYLYLSICLGYFSICIYLCISIYLSYICLGYFSICIYLSLFFYLSIYLCLFFYLSIYVWPCRYKFSCRIFCNI